MLYDTTLNIVRVYNGLLKTEPARARDIQLSQQVEVDFEDFINNYWPHLEFMILSQPDYAHPRLMEKVRQAETSIKRWIDDGESPLAALEKGAEAHDFDPATLPLLRRDPLSPELAALETFSLKETPFDDLHQPVTDSADSGQGSLPLIDAEYEKNFQLRRSQTPA